MTVQSQEAMRLLLSSHSEGILTVFRLQGSYYLEVSLLEASVRLSLRDLQKPLLTYALNQVLWS